jgi:hypothetical protein
MTLQVFNMQTFSHKANQYSDISRLHVDQRGVWRMNYLLANKIGLKHHDYVVMVRDEDANWYIQKSVKGVGFRVRECRFQMGFVYQHRGLYRLFKEDVPKDYHYATKIGATFIVAGKPEIIDGIESWALLIPKQ